MSNITITNLPVLTSLSGTSLLNVVQSGTSYAVSAQQIANLNANSGTVTSITAQAPLSGGTITTTGTIGLNTNSVSNSYLSTMAANTIKGNNSGSAAQPQDLTVAQTMSLLGAAPLASPAFTGNPTAPTPSSSDNSVSIATTAFVQAQGYVPNTVSILAGSGLTGGGTLTTSRTLSLASISSNYILANATGSSNPPTGTTLSAILDGSISAVQGTLLYRGASNWTALAPGTSGQILQSGGAGANPSWFTVTGTGSVTSIGVGTGLSSSTSNPITTVGTISLANTAVTAGSYGSASTVGTFTVNAQGQLTAAASTNIAISASQVTSGILAIAQGGTGISSLGTGVQTALGQSVTGSGGIVLATSPTLVTPTLGAASATSVAMTTGTISTAPSSGTDIVNKTYVDSVVSGNNYHAACEYATTADLGTVTYNNGSSGVGATITKTSPFATLAIDGANPTVGQRILVKNETSGQYNGIYTVTSVGSGSVGWVLTRATDYDQTGTGQNEVAPGDTTFILNGTVNANTQWVQTTDAPITIGTTPLTFVQIGASTSYTAGTGLTLTGTTFSITNTAVTAGSYGSGSSVGTFTVNAQGQLTAASNTSIAIAGSQITSGSVGATVGGTGQTAVATGDLLYGSGTNTWSRLAAGTNGYVLTLAGGVPTWAASTGGVTSFSAGTTGFTPSTGTTGAITLAGTLAIANGGTGITSFGTGVQTALGQNVTGSGSIVLATSPSISSPTLTTPTVSGNTTNTGTASRFLADFTNSTVTNRLAFQTSTSNSTTGIYALPSGTATAASWQATNAADPTNASKVLIATNGTTDVQLVSGINGTGTYLPLSFWTNGTGQFVINTSGALGIGPTATASYGTAGQVLVSGGSAAQPSWTNTVSAATTFSTSITSSILYGGTTSSSTLTLQSTSGAGSTDSIVFKVGNAGAVTAMTISTTGAVSTASTISDSIGNVRTIVQNSQTSSYTLVATDNGKHISITTGGVTVPASVFSAGQNVVIFNNSSSTQTITQGSSVTMTLAGSTTTGNRSLASYGVATVLCTGTNTFVITGQGLT
jgi:trimeric autotransporter adhesin